MLARAARELDLLRRLSEAVRLKRRDRGASDSEMLWSLVASLSAGNGALSDLNALRVDPVGCELLGLRQAPSGRRLDDYLSRIDAAKVGALHRVARDLARQLAPTAVAHEVAERGYVPVFVDGSAIEVDGALFEGAGKGYDGTMQYWLHGVFVGPLWISGRLHPGGVGVTRGWREQLEADVAPLLKETTLVWVCADNGYSQNDFVQCCTERGWDYSVSVTHAVYRRPILEMLKGLGESAWEDIGMGESATRSAEHTSRGGGTSGVQGEPSGAQAPGGSVRLGEDGRSHGKDAASGPSQGGLEIHDCAFGIDIQSCPVSEVAGATVVKRSRTGKIRKLEASKRDVAGMERRFSRGLTQGV